MPAVPYIDSGDTVTAARMNTLFEEADRKIDAALGGHSLAYVLVPNVTGTQFEGSRTREVMRRWMTSCFAFGGGRNVSGIWTTVPYDHSVFTAAVAAATVSSVEPVYSEAERWVRMLLPSSTRQFLADSLEAHTVEYAPPGGEAGRYWVREIHTDGADYGCSRIRSMHQAEILIEGIEEKFFNFPAEYNRFNFFRVHNLNAESLTVRFHGSAGVMHTVVVPARGSICVRRTGVDGTYTTGFKHFQRFLSGDVHSWMQGGPVGISNVVVSPQVLIPLIHFLAGGSVSNATGTIAGVIAPILGLDPTVRAPLPARSASLYGDPGEATTLIGDLLHHRGTFWDIGSTGLGIGGNPVVSRTVRSFNGYATLDADMAAQGIAVTHSGDDVTLAAISDDKQHDAAATGTNLFSTNGASPVRDLSAGVTLDRHMPTRRFTALQTSNGAQSASYNEIVGDGGLGAAVQVSFTIKTIAGAGASLETCDIVPHDDTVNGVKLALAAKCGAAATENSEYVEPEFHLCSNGLVLTATHEITPAAAPTQHPYLLPSIARPLYDDGTRPAAVYDVSDDAITEKRYITFTGYGWPADDEWQNLTHVGFCIPPGVSRYYGMMRLHSEGRAHPDFNDSRQANGQDAQYGGNSILEEQRDLTALTPLGARWQAHYQGNTDFDFANTGSIFLQPGVAANADVLRGLVRNFNSGSVGQWYKSNRNRLLANSQAGDSASLYPNGVNGDGIFGGLSCLFHRVPLAVEHYNAMTSKVNSIVRAKVLNFSDHGWFDGTDSSARTRPLPGPYSADSDQNIVSQQFLWSVSVSGSTQGAHVVPADCYANFPTVPFSGELLPLFKAAVTAAGLMRGTADLPQSYQLANAARVTLRLVTLDDNGPGLGGFTVTNTPLISVGQFQWCKISDIKAYAEARGWKLIHQVYGVPVELQIFDAVTGVSMLRDDGVPPYPRGQTRHAVNVQSKYAAFVEGNANAAWRVVRSVNDTRNHFVLCDEAALAPDVLAISFGSTVLELEAPVELRRTLSATTRGRPVTDDVYATRLAITDHSSDDVPQNHHVMLTPCDSVSMTPNFSRTSREAAWARRQTYGASVLPFSIVPASGSTEIIPLDEAVDEFGVITGYNGRRVTCITDNTISL